jgi:5-methylcytosine-specific restriction protein A
MPTIERKFKRLNPKIDSNNQKDRAKIYNTARWRKLRDLKLAMNPLCEMCAEAEGGSRISIAEDVHHKISFMSVDDPVKRKFLAFDFDNLQSLCKQCHQKIHNYGKKEVGV